MFAQHTWPVSSTSSCACFTKKVREGHKKSRREDLWMKYTVSRVFTIDIWFLGRSVGEWGAVPPTDWNWGTFPSGLIEFSHRKKWRISRNTIYYFLFGIKKSTEATKQTSVPSAAKVFLPPIFSSFHNLGTKRDTTKEHEMNSIDIGSICRLNRMLFCRISSRFQVKEVWKKWEWAILLPLIVHLFTCTKKMPFFHGMKYFVYFI